MTGDVFILGGKRTPMGEYVGALKDVSAIDLGATAARAALETTGVAPDEIDHTIIGNALQTSGDAIYGARHVGLKAGVPFDRPALTVNRLCGSGIQSIISGAQMIQLGEAQVCLGTRLVLTLLRELDRRCGRYGLATACIGGGQGIAMICERV
jgi:acetyl-CoA acyltransferase 2